ncbi:MAG: serine/threonine-protein kinase [Acidobacteriota bacterium]
MASIPPDSSPSTLPLRGTVGEDPGPRPAGESPPRGGGDTAERALPPGFRVGRYELRRPLGVGASGRVYEAYDPELDRALAVKLMKSLTPDAVVRLRGEARALARLSHPNVVEVYDVGGLETEGSYRLYVAMALLPGGTLGQWLAAENPSWDQILDVFVGVADGLAAAHGAGLIHRDMKPENILLGVGDLPKIVDFGLARPDSPAGDAIDARLGARKGQLIGSPAYMAPELFEGRGADARSDQFSFCVSFYEALYGRRPFAGETIPSLISNVLAGAPAPPPAGSEVPPSLHAIILKGLGQEPSERWGSMAELAAALAQEKADRRRRSQRLRRLGTGFAAAAVLAALFAGVLPRLRPADDCSPRGGIAQVWDAEREQQVARGFVASGAPFAEASWRRMTQALSAYAEAWTREQEAICGAHRTGEIADPAFHLRLACLHQRREEFNAKLKLFERADFEVAERAAGAVSWLSPPRFCRFDASALSSLSVDGDRESGSLQEARELIADSKAHRAAQQFDRALAKAVQAMTLLDTVPVPEPGLLAEAMVERGSSRKAVGGDLGEVEGLYLRALDLAESSGRDDLVADIANRILGIAVSRHELDEADRWRRLSIQAAATQPRELESALAVGRLIHESKICLAQERPRSAVEKLRRALQTTEEIFGTSHLRTASLMTHLGRALNEAGDPGGSAEVLRRALDLYSEFYGDSHPAIFVPTNTLAFTLWSSGHREEAVRYFEKGLELTERSFGPDHPNRIAALSNFAGIQGTLGEFESAIENYASALSRVRAWSEPDPRRAATLLYNLGELHLDLEQFERSEAFFREALAALESARLGEHTLASKAAKGLARSLAELGRFSEAHEVFTDALGILRRRFDAEHPRMASLYMSIAASALGQGRTDLAAEQLRRTEAVILGMAEPDLLGRLRFERLRAELALEDGRVEEARSRLEAVLAELLEQDSSRADVNTKAEERRATFALARALWSGSAAEKKRALGLARNLLDGLEEAHPEFFTETRRRVSDWVSSRSIPPDPERHPERLPV